ncbi:MAG: hypothetical protein JAZ03_08770 [Candidatus Thiodiazotropha taylori]|nr:hypothetical protein [Candidatus Thiodiazotropha taylori]
MRADLSAKITGALFSILLYWCCFIGAALLVLLYWCCFIGAALLVLLFLPAP